METQRLTINLEPLTNERYFDDEMTRSARRVVPLTPTPPARQTWKICLAAGVALCCGIAGGAALGWRQARSVVAPETVAAPVSAREASPEAESLLPPPPTPEPVAAQAAIVEDVPVVAPKPQPAKIERAAAPVAKPAVEEPAETAPPLNNGLVRPRRVSNSPISEEGRESLSQNDTAPGLAPKSALKAP